MMPRSPRPRLFWTSPRICISRSAGRWSSDRRQVLAPAREASPSRSRYWRRPMSCSRSWPLGRMPARVPRTKRAGRAPFAARGRRRTRRSAAPRLLFPERARGPPRCGSGAAAWPARGFAAERRASRTRGPAAAVSRLRHAPGSQRERGGCPCCGGRWPPTRAASRDPAPWRPRRAGCGPPDRAPRRARADRIIFHMRGSSACCQPSSRRSISTALSEASKPSPLSPSRWAPSRAR
jgi:hypothetical protein